MTLKFFISRTYIDKLASLIDRLKHLKELDVPDIILDEAQKGIDIYSTALGNNTISSVMGGRVKYSSYIDLEILYKASVTYWTGKYMHNKFAGVGVILSDGTKLWYIPSLDILTKPQVSKRNVS